jgi:hypothetical protein
MINGGGFPFHVMVLLSTLSAHFIAKNKKKKTHNDRSIFHLSLNREHCFAHFSVQRAFARWCDTFDSCTRSNSMQLDTRGDRTMH